MEKGYDHGLYSFYILIRRRVVIQGRKRKVWRPIQMRSRWRTWHFMMKGSVTGGFF